MKEPYLKIVPILTGYSFCTGVPIYENIYCKSIEEYEKAIERARIAQMTHKEWEAEQREKTIKQLENTKYLSELKIDKLTILGIQELNKFLKSYGFELIICAYKDDYEIRKVREE